MFKIAIVSGSARLGRQTPKAVSFLAQQIKKRDEPTQVQILDVKEYNFPVMEERLGRNPNPPDRLEEFGQHLMEADALVFASPEYNGSFSGALKNTLDYFRKEYAKKPIGIMTVSAGKFSGVNASHDLQKYVLALGGFPLPRKLMIGGVGNLFDDEGNLLDEKQLGSFDKFVEELLWLTDAIVRKKEGEKT
ncbi:MAG: NAD(P)H-dependent oxidoreductase [Bacteroidia bacterium]|nr:NAD(P)H-dependent oxidoreductase [Bacteroidia bacterium]